MRKMNILCAALAIFAITGLGQAATIDYTVSTLGPTLYPGSVAPPPGSPHLVDGLGYPGDAVTFVTYSGTLDLTPGVSVQKINTLAWSISYTYAGTDADWTNDDNGDWLELQFPISATRTISFDGIASGSISQAGLLEVNWENDFLGLSEGTTSTFFVPGFQIDVTPLAVGRTGGSVFTGFPAGTPWIQPEQDVTARFLVTAVPEPASMVLLAMGGLALVRRSRRA
jgi:hypothetical protein